jgi:transcriptional antiterminator NusG
VTGLQGVDFQVNSLDSVDAKWYVVHTNTSCEHKVKEHLEHRVRVMNMQDQIFEVLVPTEASPTKGPASKKKGGPKKIYPGYILVRMDLNDDSWAVVRNTPGVTGFVGLGRRPTPLQEKEVETILYQMGLQETKPVAHVSFQEGQQVKITDGPFADFIGLVDKVNAERKTLRVLIHIFGRETSIEIPFIEVEEVS